MSSMTKAHFKLIAQGLKDAKPRREDAPTKPKYLVALTTWEKTVSSVCSQLYYTNGRFDNQRFLRACGYKED